MIGDLSIKGIVDAVINPLPDPNFSIPLKPILVAFSGYIGIPT